MLHVWTGMHTENCIRYNLVVNFIILVDENMLREKTIKDKK